MGLCFPEGHSLPPGDLEDVAYLRKMLASATRTLKANGLPPHREPETLPRIRERFNVGSLPHGWFDRLKRAVAYAGNNPRRFRPLRKEADAHENSWVIHEFGGRSTEHQHLTGAKGG